jgi:hypothetical protein
MTLKNLDPNVNEKVLKVLYFLGINQYFDRKKTLWEIENI